METFGLTLTSPVVFLFLCKLVFPPRSWSDLVFFTVIFLFTGLKVIHTATVSRAYAYFVITYLNMFPFIDF